METELWELFKKETGITDNANGMCECGEFRIRDKDYIKWLETKLEERMEHHHTLIPESQARRMAWELCDELGLEKTKTINAMLDVWKDFKFIK